MADPPLASLSLTHVHYDPSDPLSHLSAYLALVPQALVITYVALIWGTREIEILLMFTGQMGCEALNWILKRYIREERPTQMLGKGYGMPSSHAQFVCYFSTSLTLFLLLRHVPHSPKTPSNTSTHASTTHIPTPLAHRLLLSLLALFSACAVAYSRIYLNYHTPRQVYIGCLAGVTCALAWYVVVSLARRSGVVDAILDMKLARMARLRDLVVGEDLVDAGWERWELRRRERVGRKER